MSADKNNSLSKPEIQNERYAKKLKALIKSVGYNQRRILPVVKHFKVMNASSLNKVINKLPAREEGKENLYALLGALYHLAVFTSEDDVIAFLKEYDPVSFEEIPNDLTWNDVWADIEAKHTTLLEADEPKAHTYPSKNNTPRPAHDNQLGASQKYTQPDKSTMERRRWFFLLGAVGLFIVSGIIVNFLRDSSVSKGAVNSSTPTFVMTTYPEQAVSSNDAWVPFEHTFENSGVATDMVLVPAGSFFMGGNSDNIEWLYELCLAVKQANHPSYTCDKAGLFNELSLTYSEQFVEPFWIDKYEVTRADYNECVATGFCSEPRKIDALFEPKANYPINDVDWTQADAYCQWREARLPTEVEWEYAARGPDNLRFPWGNEPIEEPSGSVPANHCDKNCGEAEWTNDAGKVTGKWDHITTYDDGVMGLASVGSYPAGASWVGALDMAGNVMEWTSSLYDEQEPYDRDTPVMNRRFTFKGGSFGNSIYVVVPFWRTGANADNHYNSLGFRCAMPYE